MAAPAQSYSIVFSAWVSPTSGGGLKGYALTKSGDGLSYVIATTAALAASHSGTIDGIALEDFAGGQTIQVQRDAKVEANVCSWLGNGAVENAVVDSTGRVMRASQASGVVIGQVDKEGGVSINLAGSGAVAALNLVGDVNGPTAANQVWSISGNAGAVSVLGGAWSVAAAIALAVTQLAPTSDATVHDITYETQSAYASGASNVVGGSFQVTLGANKDALTTPWLNPPVPAFYVNYRDRSLGLQNIALIEPTRFFNQAGIGAGMFLIGGNSWLDIGANPTAVLGVISVDSGTDAIASRNHADTLDMVLIGTDVSDHVVLARTGTAGVLVAPLAGSGTRMVTADPSGVLGTSTLITPPTGSGVWHITSGAPDGAASIGSANQVYVTNGAGTDTTWATTGGDVTGAITNLVVGRLQGAIVISGTPSNGQALVATSSTAASWSTVSSVTWAQDLAGSTNTNQIVIALTGTSGVTTVRASGATAALAFGAAPAASGSLRMRNADAINWRNQANSADVVGVTVDSSNQVVIGATGGASGIVCRTASNVLDFYTGGAVRLSLADTLATHSTNVAMGSNAISFGATPAAAGFLRATNNTAFNWRNAANSADVAGLTVDGSNQVILADLNGGIVCRPGSFIVDQYAGSSLRLRLDGSTGYVATPNGTNFAVGAASPTFSGSNVIYVANGTAPTAAPSGGGYLYVESGALKYRGPTTGSITTLAAA